MSFSREVPLRFHQLDPAGIAFFGEVFALCHGVYEDFIASLGFGWDEWFCSSSLASPVRHAQAEYFKPLEGGQAYTVTVQVLTLGASSFEIGYALEKEGVCHCRVRVVHVFMDVPTRAKAPMPIAVREALSRHQAPPAPAANGAKPSPKASAE